MGANGRHPQTLATIDHLSSSILGPMPHKPEHGLWWRLVRLQPFGSDGSWRFEHPYFSTMLVLVGVALAPLGINWFAPPDARVPWVVVGLICLAWVAGAWAAVRLDARLMGRLRRSRRDGGPDDASSSAGTDPDR